MEEKLFDELFVQSLDMSQKPIMCHKPSDISWAKILFDGYLTTEELCERQYTGRFWAIHTDISGTKFLYILLDNETFMMVSSETYGFLTFGRKTSTRPDVLRGYHYD